MTNPPGVGVGTTWVWFGRVRLSTGRPDRAGAAEPGPRLGPLGAVAAVAVGVLLAVLAFRVATAALPQSFRAQAVLAVVVDGRFVPDPEDAGPDWDERMAEYAGAAEPARTAASLLAETGLPAGSADSATAAATASPGSVTVTVTAGSAAEAERAAQEVLDRGIPITEPLIGPVRLVLRESPAGSAVPTGLPAEMVLAATAPAGFLLGVLLVLVVRSAALHLRSRGRSVQAA